MMPEAFGLKSEASNHPLPEIPAIVISVGPFGRRIAREVRAFYMRGDGLHEQAAQFMTLGQGDSGDLDLCQLSEGEANTANEADIATARGLGDQLVSKSRPAFEQFTGRASIVRAMLQRALHHARTHENLIASGWSGIQDVPVNLFVVADVKEPESAGYLLPMFALLREVLSDDFLCRAYLLLNVAVFPDDAFDQQEAQETQVLSFLQELNGLFGERSASWKMLVKSLAITQLDTLFPQVLLFDRRKEGSAEVKDQGGMATMVGNALLALLEGNTARRLFQGLDQGEVFEQEGYYASLGAILVGYDPAEAQAICAHRALAELIQAFLLAEPDDNEVIEGEAERIIESLGLPSDWLNDLVSDLPESSGSYSAVEDSNSSRSHITAKLGVLTFSAIDYDAISNLTWGQEILAHLERLKTEMIPACEKAVEMNARELIERLSGFLAGEGKSLPRASHLYPGGTRAATKVFGRITHHLTDLQAVLGIEMDQMQQSQPDLEAEVTKTSEQIQTLINEKWPGSRRCLPWFIRILPKNIRKKISPVYSLWRYGETLQALMRLRDQSVTQMQAYASHAVERFVLQQLLLLVQRLLTTIQSGLADITCLEKTYQSVQALVENDLAAIQAGSGQNGWDDVFRVRVTGEAWLQQEVEKARPVLARWLADMLVDDPLFAGWPELNPEAFAGWLRNRSLEAFQYLWNVSVDQALCQCGEDGPDEGLIVRCAGSVQPLLHPDFDAAGGSGVSNIASYLIGSTDWEVCRLAHSNDASCEILDSGNHYMALFFSARTGVGLSAILGCFAAGRRKLSSLPANQRGQYMIIHPMHDRRTGCE